MEDGASPASPAVADVAASDLDLVDRIKRGDAAALDALYERYSSPVYSLVWKILQSPEDAEDVAPDAFWQVWRQADRYDASRGAPPAWIFTVARSRAIDRLLEGDPLVHVAQRGPRPARALRVKASRYRDARTRVQAPAMRRAMSPNTSAWTGRRAHQ